MRIMWRAWGLPALCAASLIMTSGVLRAADQPVVHVKAVVEGGVVRLEAQANGPFEYTTYRPSASLFVLDLSGVASADPAGARVVPSELVKSYRELTYQSGQKPVVRVEVLLADGIEPQVERKDAQDLVMVVSRADSMASEAATLKPAAAHTTEVSAAAPVLAAIREVTLANANGQTEVAVKGSSPLAYHALRLRNPDRLVLDFSGSQLKTSTKHIASNLDPVREIRLAQFAPEVSRVVIDLREPSKYNIQSAGETVTVAFAAAAAAKTPSSPVNSAPVAQTSPITTTKADVPAPSQPKVEVAADEPADIPAPGTTLPATVLAKTSSYATPAAKQEGQGATQVPGQVSNMVNNANSSAAAASAPAAAAPAGAQPESMGPPTGQQAASTPAPSSRYSGEPISVNLKDVDLRDFFRLIHEISGLNVVVDPNVKGTLTIVLDDVPWDQALDIVLHNNDLDKQLDGNVLRIATRETIKKEAEETRDLIKAQAEAADVVTTTRTLSYAKAEDMATTLKKFLSSRGDILADTRSNTIIIRDVPSTLPVIDNLIRQLDRKAQQVQIEARVVAANRSFSREIGTQLAAAFGSNHNVLGGSSQAGTSPITHTPAPPLIVGSQGGTQKPASGAMPLLTNLGVGAPTSGVSYIFQSTNFALDYIITAAEEKGVGKLLSKPTLYAQNNQRSYVKQGTKIPVQTIVNNTVSVQFVDAVLELDVTPQITPDGTVFMDVTVENDQIDQSIPRVQGIPAIDTQAVNTKVTVADGATVVIGGIIVTSQRTDVQQVPLFGNFPIVGNLFRHTTVSSSSQELLFFLTPRIMPN
ncbi:MAG TPA: type IV pilus secretin PilQ [Candidatus Acidoferrales bacterium]|nr:type IV pilus secretin PilQ [Candidatus Acidoferrales bacterium]